jgi:hypothetical protein
VSRLGGRVAALSGRRAEPMIYASAEAGFPGWGISMAIEVGLQVDEGGADADRLERLALLLSEEVSGVEVEEVRLDRSGDVPAGTRGVDAATAGALVVSVAPAIQAVGNLIAAVVGWLRRGGAERTVRVKIGDDELELTGADSKIQRELVDRWLRAHALE